MKKPLSISVHVIFAICYKTGIGIKMESNCVINRSCKISFPVPVIDGLTLGVEESEANKAGH